MKLQSGGGAVIHASGRTTLYQRLRFFVALSLDYDNIYLELITVITAVMVIPPQTDNNMCVHINEFVSRKKTKHVTTARMTSSVIDNQ